MKKLDLGVCNLQCALQAFKGGADCVHLTQQFSFDEVRKLKQYCTTKGLQFFADTTVLQPKILAYITPDSKNPADLLSLEVQKDSPELTYWTARYNRLLLDGANTDDTALLWAQESLQKAGSGTPVGILVKTIRSRAIVKFSKPVAIHDILQVSYGNNTAKFSLTDVEPTMPFIPAGRTVSINFPTDRFTTAIQSGTVVMDLSAEGFPLESEEIRLYKKPVDITVTITDHQVQIGSLLFSIEVKRAEKPKDLDAVFAELLSSSGDSLFTLGHLSVLNKSSQEAPFIPLSKLKEMKRAFYHNLDSEF